MTNIIEELSEYCKEENPVGALLFTGPWGSGKTYLIEKELIPSLKERFHFIKVSLFGISNIEELKNEVKQGFISLWVATKDEKDWKESKEKLKKEDIKSLIDKIPSGLLNERYYFEMLLQFFSIENKLNGKKIILIFDDLERFKNFDTVLLGIINEYCENKGFNIILIANEDVIKSKDTYKEFKEKVIERTLYYFPTTHEVVTNIIKDMKNLDNEYRSFLVQMIDPIVTVLSQKLDSSDHSNENSNEVSPHLKSHNFRNLKYAITNFKRIYTKLKEKEIESIEKWFISFFAFSTAERANLIGEYHERYGNIFKEDKLKKSFPQYDDSYITGSIKAWIKRGMWNEETLEKELDTKIQAQRAQTPEELVKTRYFIDLDEHIVLSGFPSVLEDAYEGELLFDEYVLLIENSYWKDVLELKIEPEINWKKLQEGVDKRIDYLKNNNYQGELSKMILPENRGSYCAGALETYDLIYEKIYDEKILIFEKNRNEYLEYCKTSSDQILYRLSNKRFDRFDEEMARATASLFKGLDNYKKNVFVSYFYDMWESWNINLNGISDETEKGFASLKNWLEQDKGEYDKIGIYHVNSFIERLDTLLAKKNKKEITEEKTNED